MDTRLLDRIFNDIMAVTYSDCGMKYHNLSNSFPFCDIYTSEDKSLVFEFAVAGYKKENLHVTVNDDILTVEGKTNEEEKKYIFSSIKKVNFSKSYKLQDRYDMESVKVELIDGILKVAVGIKPEKAPKRLEIL